MNTRFVSEDDLHAYVDGYLPAEKRAEIERYLAVHPEQVELVSAYREQNQALKVCFAPILDEALPHAFARWSANFQKEPDQPRGFFLPLHSLQRIAAGLFLLVIGGLAGWVGHAQLRPAVELTATSESILAAKAEVASLPRQAAVAHVVYSPDVRRPVEIGADQEEQLIGWLSKRLGTPVRPPKLGALGYELIGGRLLPGTNGPVAQFMYQDAANQRLTIYVSTENASNRTTGFRFAQEGAVNVFYWVDGKFGYALSAGIAKADLARIATAVYDQLEAKKTQ